MKIYKNFTLFFLFISFSISGQQDSKSFKLLDEVSMQMKSYDNFEFDFKYSLENQNENIKQETFGKIIISENKYKLSITGLEQLFDGTNVYTIIPENKEITITDIQDDESLIVNPLDLLSFYKTGYELKWDIVQYVNKIPIQYIKLIPNKEKDNIKYLLLGVNTVTKNIYKLIEIGDQRTTTTLTINNISINKQIPEKFFSLNESDYPDYYID